MNKKPPKMPWKSHDNTAISGTKVREGGRTVGSGRVAGIIEMNQKIIVSTADVSIQGYLASLLCGLF